MAAKEDTATRTFTADDLLSMPDDGLRRELVRGELREMAPAGHRHGRIALRIAAHLLNHVDAEDLGVAYAAETGFRLSSSTVRAPDASFVAKKRAAAVSGERGFWPGAPDLAIEVTSPDDGFEEVEEKVFDWLDAGTRMVVLVNPRKRSVTIYRSHTEIVALREADTLDGGDVVPGWSLPVAHLFR